MKQTIWQHTFRDTTLTLDETIDYINPDIDYVVDGIEHYDLTMASILEDVVNRDSPKILYLQDLMPHFPFKYDETGTPQDVESDHIVSMYLPQQKYTVKVMLGMVDYIIEKDPDAVIIIQGDHGIHAFSRNDLASQGFTDEQMLEMNFSTISAVRIPPQYGTLTEPLDPLDITRYLVNHYVGEGNYEYLYYYEED
jgi:hypothetical protein